MNNKLMAAMVVLAGIFAAAWFWHPTATTKTFSSRAEMTQYLLKTTDAERLAADATAYDELARGLSTRFYALVISGTLIAIIFGLALYHRLNGRPDASSGRQ